MTGGSRLLHLIALGFIALGCNTTGLWSAVARADTPEPRIALVIGNSAYGSDIGNLANPANDAKLMAATLRGAGWSSNPFLSRSAARTFAAPAMRLNVNGFRIARDL